MKYIIEITAQCPISITEGPSEKTRKYFEDKISPLGLKYLTFNDWWLIEGDDDNYNVSFYAEFQDDDLKDKLALL